MKYDIIKTDNYLLVVDEREIKVGDWYYVPRTNKAYKCEYDPTELEMEKRFGVREVIAHLPLNGSPILEGVDLLPPLEEKDEKSMFANEIENILEYDRGRWYGRIEGYNKAKEKYKYTEEDLIKAIDMAFERGKNRIGFYSDYKKFIQSLSQPKMPIGFEFEASKSRPVFIGEPKTRWNVAGFTRWTWEGKYIYE